MAARAIVAHRTPGRVRLMIPEKRGDEEFFAHLTERLGRLPEVEGMRANVPMGSIAVRSTGEIDAILRQAEDDDLLAIVDALDDGRPRVPRALVPALNLVSGREINRMFMLGSALVVVGTVQVFKGSLFPPAFSIYWAAMEAFRRAQSSSRRGTEMDGTKVP